MSNAERFIGDEDVIDTFIEEFAEYLSMKTLYSEKYLKDIMVEFFKIGD